MSNIQRSLKTSEGSVTVNNGDVVVTDPDKGILLKDNVGDTVRIKVIDVNGIKTVEIEQV
jgi:hypothetical protein